MQTRSAIVLALLLATLAGPGGDHARAQGDGEQPAAQPTDLPQAESLFEAYIEAIGGREALARHQNRVLHGIYRIAANGDTQILTLYCETPNRLLAELEAPALGTTIRATNGAVAWGTNASGTPFRLDEAETASFNDNAIFLNEAAYKERYKSIRTAGTAVFDGKNAYQVDFVTHSGLQGSIYFDAESKLVVGRQLKNAEGQGPLVLVTAYKEFEGVMLPTLQQQRFQDVQTPSVDIEFRWVEVNVDDLPSFDPPAQLTAPTPAPGG
ncbi:MAG TPA: hypothetical protein VFF69_10815 [Phycisphaerales bacterium]|nr:hypothetical protein [Phycisphaerales bacterium]